MLKNVFTRVIMIYITIATCTIWLSNCSEDLATFNEIKSPVVLLSPADGAKIAPEEFPIVFSWTPQASIKEYTLEIDGDNEYVGTNTSFTFEYNKWDYPISLKEHTWSISAKNNFQIYPPVKENSFMIVEKNPPFDLDLHIEPVYYAFCDKSNIFHETMFCIKAQDDSGVDDITVYVHEKDYTYPADMYEPAEGDTQGKTQAYGHFKLNGYDLPCGKYTLDINAIDIYGNKTTITREITLVPDDIDTVEVKKTGAILLNRWKINTPDKFIELDEKCYRTNKFFINQYISSLEFDEKENLMVADYYISPHYTHDILIFDTSGNIVSNFYVELNVPIEIKEGFEETKCNHYAEEPQQIGIYNQKVYVKNNEYKYKNRYTEKLYIYNYDGDLLEKKDFLDENGDIYEENLDIIKYLSYVSANGDMFMTCNDMTNFDKLNDTELYIMRFDENIKYVSKYKVKKINTGGMFFLELGYYNIDNGIFFQTFTLGTNWLLAIDSNNNFLYTCCPGDRMSKFNDINGRDDYLLVIDKLSEVLYKNHFTGKTAYERFMEQSISLYHVLDFPDKSKSLLEIPMGHNDCVTVKNCLPEYSSVTFGEDKSIIYAAGPTTKDYFYNYGYWKKTVDYYNPRDKEIEMYKFRLCGLE